MSTTTLITNIKTRAAMPTSQNTFTASKLLVFADDELRTALLPMIMRVRESYFSYDKDYSISSTNYASGYPIPARAIGGKVQDVFLLDNSGGRLSVDLVTEDIVSNDNESPTGNPACYLKNNKIILVPEVPSGYSTLRVSYFIRPNTLVETSACALISAINTGSGVITCTNVPTTFSASTPLDAVKGTPHFDHIGIDETPSSVSTGSNGTITVSTTLAAKLAVGDYLCLAEQAPVIQLPLEFHSLLAQRVANRCMQAQGDMTALKAGEEVLSRMEAGILGLINPRIENEAKKIINRSGLTRRS